LSARSPSVSRLPRSNILDLDFYLYPTYTSVQVSTISSQDMFCGSMQGVLCHWMNRRGWNCHCKLVQKLKILILYKLKCWHTACMSTWILIVSYWKAFYLLSSRHNWQTTVLSGITTIPIKRLDEYLSSRELVKTLHAAAMRRQVYLACTQVTYISRAARILLSYF
jgi:hypothetical protein